MHFTAPKDSDLENVWNGITGLLDSSVREEVSPLKSRFYKTLDGIECELNRADGSLIAICYSESDRMGNRRWSIDIDKDSSKSIKPS